jgi:ATP-dependent RNA helicase DHX57
VLCTWHGLTQLLRTAKLLPSVRLTLRNASLSKVVLFKRTDSVADVQKVAVGKLKTKKSALHASWTLGSAAPQPLRDLHSVPDGAAVEFSDSPADSSTRAASGAASSSSSQPAADEPAQAEAAVPEEEADAPADALLVAARAARSARSAAALAAALLSPAEAVAESARLLATAGRAPPAMSAARAALPCAAHRADFLSALSRHAVLLLRAETGSGKSTQAPQYVLEDAVARGAGATTNILVAQPRRVAASSLARRVADERGEALGDVVGCAMRGARHASRRTRILYCTTGVLLRLLTEGGASLARVSHVFIDEVHERSVEVDLCMLLLRRMLHATAASTPRVCLMSATADAEALAAYFGGAPSAAVLRVPGRAHPVRTLFLEDVLEAQPTLRLAPPQRAPQRPASAAQQQQQQRRREGEPAPQVRRLDLPPCDDGDDGDDRAPSERDAPLPPGGYSAATMSTLRQWDGDRIDYALLTAAVAHAVAHLCAGSPSGAVLVFLPGAAEIARAAAAIGAHPVLARFARCVPLHGSLPVAAQQRAFEPAPPGVTKVVLSTNVAETAVTIPDCTVVVDTCRVKEMSFDAARGMTRLADGAACRAALTQRAGRAGRVRPGTALRLLPRAAFDALPHASAPELLRTPLEAALLSAHLMLPPDAAAGGNAAAVALLRAAPSPPPAAALDAATATLRCVGALDVRGALTPLGLLLAHIPVDARLAKMCVYASLLGCLPAALTIAAALATRSPFAPPPDRLEAANEARRRLAAGRSSDHLAVLAAYDGWRAAKRRGRGAERAFLDDNALSASALREMEDVRAVLRARLSDAGIIADDAAHDGGGDGADAPPGCREEDAALLRGVLAAGLWPRLARVSRTPPRRPGDAPGTLLLAGPRAEEVYPHPGSINAKGLPDGGWVAYLEAVETSRAFVRESTLVSPFAVALFCGDLAVDHGGGAVACDGWARFRAPPAAGVLLKRLRARLGAALLARVAGTPPSPADEATTAAVIKLLRAERPPPTLRRATGGD